MSKMLRAKQQQSKKVEVEQPKKVANTLEKPNTATTSEENTKELDMYSAALDADKAQLKKFSTLEEKNDYKATALENTDYIGFITQYIKSGAHYPNRVFAWFFVWLVDLGRWQQALSYLPLLVKQQQPLPTIFNTKEWTTFFIDQLYDAGAIALQAQQNEPNAIEKSGIIKIFSALNVFIEQEKPIVNDVVLGKFYAMAAKLEFEIFNLGNAYLYSVKATQVNDKAGVKGLTKKVTALIQLNAEVLNKEKEKEKEKNEQKT